MNSSTAYAYGIASMAHPGNLAGTVLCSVSFFSCFFSAFWIVVNRDLKAVQQSQPAAMFLALFSLALLDGSIILSLGRPMNVGLCVGRMWGAQLALFAFLTSQLMKGWVLFRYTQSARTSVFKAAEDNGLIASLAFLFIFAIILLCWTILEPLEPRSNGIGCKSSGQGAEIASITCLTILWFLWFFFGSQTYELRTRFTDHNYITCFFSGLAGVMAIVSGHALESTVFTPEIRFATEAACASLVSFLVIGFGVIPKLWADESDDEALIFSKSSGRKGRRRGTSASTMSRTASAHSLVSHDGRGRGSVHSNHSRRSSGLQSAPRSSRVDRHRKLSELRSSRTPQKSDSQLSVYQPSSEGQQLQQQVTPYQPRRVRYEDEQEEEKTPEPAMQQQHEVVRVMTVYNPPSSFNEMGMWL